MIPPSKRRDWGGRPGEWETQARMVDGTGGIGSGETGSGAEEDVLATMRGGEFEGSGPTSFLASSEVIVWPASPMMSTFEVSAIALWPG